MVDFLLADFNTGFAIALGLVITLGLLEGLGMLIGLSLMGLLDQISPIEIDLEVDADFTDGGVTSLLGWLCLNRLPLLIWLVLFLLSFGISGYSFNFILLNNADLLLPNFLVYGASLVSAILLTRYLGKPLGKLLPKNESSAVSNNSFKGLVAKITIGTAKENSPAEASLVDHFNQKHYVLVSPDDITESFSQGEEVVLVEKQNNIWLVIKFIH
jgi:hypothetical protein